MDQVRDHDRLDFRLGLLDPSHERDMRRRRSTIAQLTRPRCIQPRIVVSGISAAWAARCIDQWRRSASQNLVTMTSSSMRLGRPRRLGTASWSAGSLVLRMGIIFAPGRASVHRSRRPRHHYPGGRPRSSVPETAKASGNHHELAAQAIHSPGRKGWDAEVVVDIDLARTLLSEQFPALLICSMTPMPAGCHNSVWLVNNELVFRFPRREIAISGVKREIEILPELAPWLPLAVPVPGFVGRPSDEFAGRSLARHRSKTSSWRRLG